jgi:hypothetical protein
MREEIKQAIIGKDPQEFLSEYIYDRVPFIFSGDRSAFISWKHELGHRINIDPYSILFVGSSAIGVSLNPYKNLRLFDKTSDVDLAIVSNYYFTLSWHFMRNNSHLRTRLDPKLRTAWDDHVTRLIYWGAIATDKILSLFPFGKEWTQAVEEMSRKQPTFGRQINLRIYSDYDSLRAYQVIAVKNIRESLLSEGGQNAEIP